ncbi:PREDICTED: E3 ubiquitin-protein ligase BOI-like [Ipomoea nil]|uniref:E3 ubiquitin-protein ligase BOI-like n=1 Tax=Ipomoea nil TaxID=35883 RepID=UPI000900DF67|nr:PREDICTED: E3 ubiquitin-protein ligase BOI-like [Ipomoea nil]
MAVQAQYPSNVLFFNRSLQDGKNPLTPLGNDYSFQNHGGGGGGAVVDQTQIRLNPADGSNSRKRAREHEMNPLMSMQSQQPKIIDLAQLHASPPPPPPNVVSTGLRLAFGEQQTQQQFQQQQQSSVSPQSSLLFSVLAEDLSTHIKHQRDEIDQFLRAQGDQLRRTLEEKRQRHYRALLGAAEESVARKLREKEAEVEKAARRNSELHARAQQLSAEAQAWQARARAQEVTAATLQAQLQQVIMNAGAVQEREDGNAPACGAGGDAEDAESAYIDPDRVVLSPGPSCKACRKRIASVVVLPCRHLCLCSACDAVAQACPLCLSVRSSSVEVFLC